MWRSRLYGLELAWVVFALINLGAMLRFPGQATLPFHFIWVSLAIVYGLRVWKPIGTIVALASVMAATTYCQLQVGGDPMEFAEIPLMGAMFMAMVWHARRRRIAMDEVQAAAQREQDFLRDASHTLRTPVTIARGHAELIRAASDSPGLRADADVVIDELANISMVTDRILMLAAAEHTETMHFAPTSSAALVRDVGSRWQVAADREWAIVVDDDSEIGADVDQLVVALDSLIENAVKHTSPGDTIRLEAGRDGPWAVLRVADSGEGIEAENLPHIFERFYRTGVGERRGTGLGLPIAKRIVEAHGGTVSVRSTVGTGTTMSLRVPAIEPGRPQRPPAWTRSETHRAV